MKKATALLIMILLVGCQAKITSVVFENRKQIGVEIADNTEERTKGLMHRTELGEDKGMLFVFDEEKERSFWMKNTLIPLDMIFLTSEKEIIKIHTAEPCKKDPCQLYDSINPAKYVIEVNAGFCEKNNISIGQRVSFK